MDRGLSQSGIPLGGIGTGSVELRRDGYFHKWEIMNNPLLGKGPWVDVPANAMFFGMQVTGKKEDHSLLLGTAPEHDYYRNNPYDMPWLAHAENIEAEQRFPVTKLDYKFEKSPVKVSLEAFSPFIPLDSKNSGMPLAYFNFELKNRSDKPLKISLYAALRNLCGYANQDNYSSISFESSDSMGSLNYSREGVDAGASDAGTMSLGVCGPKGGVSSYVAHPRNCRDIWEPLRATGELENTDVGNFSGELGNVGASQRAYLRKGLPFGVLCHTITLPAKATEKIRFIFCWHFPNFMEGEVRERKKKARRIGHMYNKWYKDSSALLADACENSESLRARTLEFAKSYYKTTLPAWLLEAISAQFTTMIKSSWWDEKNRFGIWEGLGCCGLQTTDVSYYGATPILSFFPDLEKSQMRLTVENAERPGKIPHMMPGNFSCCDVDHRNRIDLIPGFIMLAWRDILWTGDLDYARELWPVIEKGLEVVRECDTDGDGLPNNSGPDQTYDQFPLQGTSAYVGFLYAASLENAADIARLIGKEKLAQTLKKRSEDAVKKLEEQLWNGKYYSLCNDIKPKLRNEGVMIDQTTADRFMRLASNRGLLPDARIKSVLKSIVSACSRPQGFLSNCAWPKGDGITIGRHTADQANWPWSGVEYAFAAYLIKLGMEKEGLKVARDIWERHERAGLRFNHIECGEHYYRAMSSWDIYLALTGFALDANTKSLRLCAGEKGQYVLSTPTCWGTLKVSGGKFELSLKRGSLELTELVLGGVSAKSPKLSLNDCSVKAKTVLGKNGLVIAFAQELKLTPGKTLRVGLKG